MTLNGTMANSAKKRKASELDTEENGGGAKTKSRNHSKKNRRDSRKVEDIPFKTECPYKPSTKQNDDVFVQRDTIAPGFEFEYGIRPGQQWKAMKSYRNVKLQDHTFSSGTIIYINKQNPPPKSPRSDATDAEILQYDRTNFWVGRIADTRAVSDKAVFLRVYWLYWPEELPMGRQPYHSDRELIQSNAMDIIDAQTISWAADLTYWDENDLNFESNDRFWRQTFDISQLGKDKRGGLSELRKHCHCKKPQNPDKTMFQCKRSDCKTWNHEECLLEHTLQRVWPLYEKDGTLDTLSVDMIKVEGDEKDSSIRDTLLSPVRQLGKMVQNKMTPSMNTIIDQSVPHQVETNSTPTPKRSRQKKAPVSRASPPPPWNGKLTAHIVAADENDDDSSTLAKVEEVPAAGTSKSQARSWLIRVNCVECDRFMD